MSHLNNLIQTNHLIQFVQIKPNSEKSHIDLFNDNLIKILNLNTLNSNYNEIENIRLELDEYTIQHKQKDPITFINQFFKNINSVKSSESDLSDDLEQYEVLSYSYDESFTKIYLMLTNKLLNSVGYIDKKTKSEQMSNFNLLASSLIKHYNNSIVVFGDVFIMSIDKEYYKLLMNLQQIEYSTLNNFKTIYYDFKINDIIKSYSYINYVRIYTKPDNKVYIYRRDMLDSFIKEYKYDNIPQHNIIKATHLDKILYIKFYEDLPNSQNHIINNALTENNEYSNLYYINLTDTDINLINNLY